MAEPMFYAVGKSRLDSAVKVLNSVNSTAGDYRQALAEIVSFADPIVEWEE